MAESLSIEFEYEDVRQLLRILRGLPKEASAEVRTLSKEIAAGQAEVLKAAASSSGDKRVRAQAGRIRARRDRVPVIALGGAARAGVSGGATVGEVLFGTEFGADQDGPNGWRFPARSSPEGYWAFPTLRRHHPTVVKQWESMYEFVLERWAGKASV